MKYPVSRQIGAVCAAAVAVFGFPCLTLCPSASAQTAASAQKHVPSIKRLLPALAPAGSLVQIEGTGFSGATFVSFNRVPAEFTVNSDRQITAIVPSGAVSGPVQVNAPGGTVIRKAAFTLGTPKVTLTGLKPTQGSPGKLVQITGTGFTGATSVKFGPKPARFRVVSDTVITVTVPPGAATGPVSVATPYGVVTSAPFTVR